MQNQNYILIKKSGFVKMMLKDALNNEQERILKRIKKIISNKVYNTKINNSFHDFKDYEIELKQLNKKLDLINEILKGLD